MICPECGRPFDITERIGWKIVRRLCSDHGEPDTFLPRRGFRRRKRR